MKSLCYISLISAMLLAGCGQMGALYLPDKNQPTQQRA